MRPRAPQPPPSAPSKGSRRFPYLPRDRAVRLPSQVWGTGMTYVRLGGRHTHLTAVIDWCSRHIAAWRLSDTVRDEGVAACAGDAFRRHGTPSTMNSDQGSVFGSKAHVSLLEESRVTRSMDGRARWADGVLAERWFRTLELEFLGLQGYDAPAQLGRLVSGYVTYHNDTRIHDSLGHDRPRDWYYSGIAGAT